MTGLLDYCAFYQIGCVQHLVLSVHSYCILIVCFYSAKPVHIQSWKPTCSHICLKSYTQKPTVSSTHLSTVWKAPALLLWHRLIQLIQIAYISNTLQHTPTAVATICHVVLKRSLPLGLFFWFWSAEEHTELHLQLVLLKTWKTEKIQM